MTLEEYAYLGQLIAAAAVVVGSRVNLELQNDTYPTLQTGAFVRRFASLGGGFMTNRIYRSRSEPIREGLSYTERWEGPDHGLITAWEVGRRLRQDEPEIAERASKGELPISGWKGGVERALKKKTKFGTLKYLAEWQGLRGEDLDIDLDEEVTLVCSRTGMEVTYTLDRKKYAEP